MPLCLKVVCLDLGFRFVEVEDFYDNNLVIGLLFQRRDSIFTRFYMLKVLRCSIFKNADNP